MNFQDYSGYFGAVLKQIDAESVYGFIKAIRDSDHVIVAGNGGSSATASHFAQDLMKGCHIKAICLTDNTGLLTAYSNDDSYGSALTNIADRMGVTEKTLAVVLSGSGKSANVLSLASKCRKFGLRVVALTGFDGGTLKNLCDINVHVPLDDMETVESIHSMILHYVVKELKK